MEKTQHKGCGCITIAFTIFLVWFIIYFIIGIKVYMLRDVDFNDGADYTLVYSLKSLYYHPSHIHAITDEKQLESIKRNFYTFKYFSTADSIGYTTFGEIDLFRNGKLIKSYRRVNYLNKYGGNKDVEFKPVEQFSEDEIAEFRKIDEYWYHDWYNGVLFSIERYIHN